MKLSLIVLKIHMYTSDKISIHKFTKRHNSVRYVCFLWNPGRDISFPIFTRKEIETKRITKEIKTIISRLNDLK